MKAKICWIINKETITRIPNMHLMGQEDYIFIEGETIEDLQKQAQKIVEDRNLTDYWSEMIEDE